MKLPRKPLIIAASILTAGGATLAIAAPAMAADNGTHGAKSSITVKVDKADHEATVTTAKRGVLTVKWDAIGKGRVELVTVRNSDGKLVAARDVPAKRLDEILNRVAEHPGAIRNLWQAHHHAGAHKHAKAKTGTTASNS